jgi:hypothetical protein
MIFENVELHNVETVLKAKDGGWVIPQRVPEYVSNHLNPFAQTQMICLSGVEIRFVCECYPVEITLEVDGLVEAVKDVYSEVTVFFGVYQHIKRYRVSLEPTTIKIYMPFDFQKNAARINGHSSFSPNVCRLRLWGPALSPPIRIHGIKSAGKIRPPKREELPKLRYLAYGSSLTQGAVSSAPHICYTSQVGSRL